MNATIFLRIIAAILLLFGVIYLLNPALLAGKAGLTANASGLTDIRATYGGFQIGFGLFLLWVCKDPRQLSLALAATMLIFGSVGAARLFGVVTDGELSGFNQIGLGFELILTAACAFFLYREKKDPA